jgi:signal transduction histidine kinase
MLQVLLDDVSEQWKILTDGISHSSDPAFAKFLLVLAAVLTIVVLIATCAALCPSNPKPTTPTKKRK